MDLSDTAARAVFFEAHRDLPREAPGSAASTARALELVRAATPIDAPTIGPPTIGTPAPVMHRVLDVACGPGMQTLELARLLPAVRITALDLYWPFLEELRRRASVAGFVQRIDPVRADMTRLPFPGGAFDLVWCEGGAYLAGVENALTAWRALLAPGGRIAFTDAVWLCDDPPEPVRAFWQGYPGMCHPAGVREKIRRCGLEPAGDFVLPERDWWDDYYVPLERRLEMLRARYAGDATAFAVLEGCQAEIDLYRAHSDCYGYAFFVASA